MKIGFLVDKPSFGGGERVLMFLMSEFHKRGHEIIIYSWNQEWEVLQENKCIDYEIHILKNPPVGLKGKVQAYINLKRELLHYVSNCLIIFSLGLAEIGVWVAKQVGVPVLLSERVDPRYLPASMLHRFFKKLVFRKCDGIVFQTEEIQNYFSCSIKKKGIVIPNPLLDDNLPVANIDNPRKEIVAVGRLSIEKNFEMLIKAFSESNLSDYKLRIYGEGPLRQDLQELIEQLRVENRVILEGQVERIVDRIQGADIFVLPSNHEGMPNVLLEAMAMGLACISTDFPSGGAKSLINSGINGLLIPINDKEALKNAISILVGNQKFKSNLKRNALNIRITNSKERVFPKWESFVLFYCKKYC